MDDSTREPRSVVEPEVKPLVALILCRGKSRLVSLDLRAKKQKPNGAVLLTGDKGRLETYHGVLWRVSSAGWSEMCQNSIS